MTREIKLALILGCALVLVVGVLISDHFSGARRTPIVTVGSEPLTVVSRREDVGFRDARADVVRPAPAAPANTELSRILTDPNPAPQVEPSGETVVALADPAERQAQSLIAAQDQRLMEEARNLGVDLAAPGVAGIDGKTVPGMKEHTVKTGETLWEIAQKHYGDGSQYKRIVEANKDRLGAGKMAAGLKLRIPPKNPPAVAAVAMPAIKTDTVALKVDAAKADPAKADPKSDKKRVYTVREGDTLAKIAERTLGSRNRARELASINNLKDPDDISIGLELRLPTR